jgi:hypothetical protein
MKRILIVVALASLVAFGQKIETQKADRLKITRVATTQNHLTVLEFSEPVREVAVGSSTFNVEWRENKVFVQPLEADGTTNLFIWTASGRQSYELVPARDVADMHFAIDEEPAAQARPETPTPPPIEQPKVPAAMLMESRPVRNTAAASSDGRVQILLQDVYESEGRIFLRYAIVNGSRVIYVPAAPDVFTLTSPRSPQSLIPLVNTQLANNHPLRWKGQAQVAVQHAEVQAPMVPPGQAAHGLVAFDRPAPANPGGRTVVRLAFPADATGVVSALLVL